MVTIVKDNNITTTPDMSVQIGKLKLSSPILTASGTCGYADELENYINFDSLGAIVTKGITLTPRAGNPQPRLAEVKNGMINCIGLENIGIEAFIEEKLPFLNNKEIPYIVNVAGFSFEEYFEMARISKVNNIKAIELNVSCPNVKEGCIEFGTDPETLYRLVSQVREIYDGTLIVKLTPNVTSPVELALSCQRAGADAISAINTVKAMDVKINCKNGRFNKTIVKGGLSGPAIKNIALNFIHSISRVVDIPIIGMGGITNHSDIIEFFAVGATAIQIGTANFIYPEVSQILYRELADFMTQNGFSTFSDLIEGVQNDNSNQV